MKSYAIVLFVVGLMLISACTNNTQSTPQNVPSAVIQADDTAVSGGQEQVNGIVDVQMKDFKFIPDTVTIKKGRTVRWTQIDTVKHTITSVDDKFESGLMGQGAQFTHKFDEAGTYDYHCTPHPTMRGSVIVE